MDGSVYAAERTRAACDRRMVPERDSGWMRVPAVQRWIQKRGLDEGCGFRLFGADSEDEAGWKRV